MASLYVPQFNELPFFFGVYDTIRMILIFACNQKLEDSKLSLPQGTNRELKKNVSEKKKTMKLISPVQYEGSPEGAVYSLL